MGKNGTVNSYSKHIHSRIEGKLLDGIKKSAFNWQAACPDESKDHCVVEDISNRESISIICRLIVVFVVNKEPDSKDKDQA